MKSFTIEQIKNNKDMNQPEDIKYPECEKMNLVREKSQVIGEFLEWVAYTKKLVLATNNDEDDAGYYSIWYGSTEQLLAEFFEIDLNKVEKEKRQMLDDLRSKTKQK